MKDSIKQNDDGSYTVEFKGDPMNQPIIVPSGDYSAFSGGDKDVQIFNAAADQYFRDGGEKDGVEAQNPGPVFQLLTGRPSLRHSKSDGDGPKEIRQCLIDAAPHLGKDLALVATGNAGDDGNVSWGNCGHATTISKIDVDNGTVTYLNPWDPSRERTVSIDVMADQMGNSHDSSSELHFLPTS